MNKTLIIMIACSIIAATSVGAAETGATETSTASQGEKGYAGILFGGNSTTNSPGDNQTTTTFGATAGAKLASEFGIGLFGSYYSQKSSGSFLGLPSGASTSTAVITGQGNFFAGGFHFGAEAGPAISSWSGYVSNVNAGDSRTVMVYGPEGGYDYKLSKTASIGAEAHYLLSTGDSSIDNIQFLAALKVWM